ncbi:hypothetical protein A2U01_0096521, partial [Trifolium medium]|nr:hypothetical protein [Trifolium medium]
MQKSTMSMLDVNVIQMSVETVGL